MAVQNPPAKPRGRPREFDPDVAVERAMAAFWTQGYHGTSLYDLLEATKLSRGSMYAEFGDKRGLFLRALDRYIDNARARVDKQLEPGRKALAGVRECLAGYVERSAGQRGKRGCLVVASAMELAAHDADVAKRIRRFFDMMEDRLTRALARAKAEGDLAEDVEPAHVARMFLWLVEGMRVVGKTGSDPVSSLAIADTFLQRFARRS